MTQAELKTLPSGKLFGYCASYFDDDRYWEEFVRRFNPCLTNSVYQTYRRFITHGPPPFLNVSAFPLKNYVTIFKEKNAALHRPRRVPASGDEVDLREQSTAVT